MNVSQEIEQTQRLLNRAIELASGVFEKLEAERNELEATKLTQEEAGRILNKSTRTVRRMIQDGRIKKLTLTEIKKHKSNE